jgi:UDP-N-acetyl-D-glucosamine dehydrogenase
VKHKTQLLERIENRTAKVGMIGLGYAGLPLAVEFARRGLRVQGVDLDADKVAALHAGRSYVADVSAQALAQTEGRLRASCDYADLADADAVVICVPTPLRKSKDPDLSYIAAATEQLLPHVRAGMLIVLESTTYPGTTEEILAPRLTERGLIVGTDIFLAFSPERVDPGNAEFTIHNTPKVVGGMTPACSEVAAALYRRAVAEVVAVSSARAAEMVKLLENTFRAVNIALVNEVALMCNRLDINVWEVIDAAATKPYGFMRFTPGPGIGGHCIPVDPLYLSWKMRGLNYKARFIDLADEVNAAMPAHVVTRTADALAERGLALRGADVLVIGAAYKPDVADVRESPALDVMVELQRRGARVRYHDPLVPALILDEHRLESVPLDEASLRQAQVVIIVTPHRSLDLERVAVAASLIVDTRNALRGRGGARVVGL